MTRDLANLKMKEIKKIVRLYEKKLKIPIKKLNKLLLICPVGFVGAGKTTVIKPLSRQLSVLRISTDEIRKILKDNGYNYDRAKEITFYFADKFLARGFSIALDTNCASIESQKYIKAIKNKFRVKVIWLHINPPEKFIINKLKNYRHTWLFENSDNALRNYYHTKVLYKDLTFPYLYTFDPSKPNLKYQIKEAANLIGKIVS